MNDYKELIAKLRNAGGGCDGIKMCHDAAKQNKLRGKWMGGGYT